MWIFWGALGALLQSMPVLHDTFHRRYSSLMFNYNFMIGTDRKREWKNLKVLK